MRDGKIILALLLTILLTGCDRIESEIFGSPEDTYLGCLKSSFNGGHQYKAEETRQLCEEISGSSEPHYKLIDGKFKPGNEFTECYDLEKKNLENKKVENPGDIAVLICKYGKK